MNITGTPLLLRLAQLTELETLCDIDQDACQLFDQAGLALTASNSLEYAAAERRRWLKCLQAGATLIATNPSGEPIGFAALRTLDREPYLEQLSVRMKAMRRGVGTALLCAAERVAVKMGGQQLSLTTYRHLPWNAPFYEKAGFLILPTEDCGSEVARELAFQRRMLPAPAQRIVMRKSLPQPSDNPRRMARTALLCRGDSL